jgi:small subunit ribosomal protein S17e
MGNIRPNYIKRIALELVQNYPTVFNDDFENNKLLVSKLTNVESIVMRNRIAGYVTTYWQHMEQ